MDLSKILLQLHSELDNLEAAILSLERLQQEGRRRGRPPKLLAEMRKANHPPGRQSESHAPQPRQPGGKRIK